MNRLIPPVLFLMLLIPLALLWAYHPEDLAMRYDRQMPWDIPLILGAAILIWARVHFRSRQAEIHTFKTPRHLVTDGPFRFSRNPMYLGFLLLLVAAAFFVNVWCAVLAPAIFLAAAAFWYIPHEEAALRATLGEDYEAYSRRVRRWI
ncbi:methyltransferase family protein [Pelagerythrobacter rhizovicinus]|uniref:Isoprenylcysteine carboxylmethyltransferase family protein n=1 Tax=Pelagerythrobacter rhizovicinus TaxID=2268576 RepID=A0A4V1QVZ8_9SPHN|nr:isoprenylcysteine carboxylmethyltransferase family protein [Pelagerythrobacter rhizovicinus]RXZ64406.1 isoprenylcysteine carboxylmethyltransferase family protein [Pelagerythrobacter rhizovicinus]